MNKDSDPDSEQSRALEQWQEWLAGRGCSVKLTKMEGDWFACVIDGPDDQIQGNRRKTGGCGETELEALAQALLYAFNGRRLEPDAEPEKQRCCSLRDGVHDSNCPTNNEMHYYRCRDCQKPEWQAAMSCGLCRECRKNQGMVQVESPYRRLV